LRLRRDPGLALVAAMVLACGSASGQPAAKGLEQPGDIVIESAGNQLFVQRDARVPYTRMEDLLRDLNDPQPARAAAIRLLRLSPSEMAEYLLCITAEGLLLLGEQRRAFDYAKREYVFVRGELGRGYRPLEQPGPWTWLVEVPLSRERRVTLEVRAGGSTWPIERVTITASAHP
jgi:hypothetical protein